MRIATTIVEANDDEEDNLDLFYEDSDNALFNSYPAKWFRGEHLGSIWDICPLFLVPPSICLTIF